jgi:hypothetical protein
MRSTHVLHLPPLGRTSGRRPPPWHTRVLAHVRGAWLDRQLARGVPSWRSHSHAARALQLTSDRTRRAVARSLEQLAGCAAQPTRRFEGAAISPCREQVRDASSLMGAMASRLRSGEPLEARGIARLRDLLRDGGGPCYAPCDPEALTHALQEISQWLDVRD